MELPLFTEPAPTEEQAEAVELFKKSGNLKISAFAGTGKTSTLVLCAKSTSKRGVYLAFNRPIADEAKGRFPETTSCSTTHSLAFRAVASQFKERPKKLSAQLNPNMVVSLMGLERLELGEHVYPPGSVAFLVLETVRRFCLSDARSLENGHVPSYGLLAASQNDKKLLEDFKSEIVRLAGRLWARMENPTDDTYLGHDGYLKLWALGRPKIEADFILLDEAQDSNPVVLGALGRQRGAQLVYVGDRHQQIYEWRGAVNAMEIIATPAETLLTQSFRFGEPVAAAATRVLRTLGEANSLRGNPAIKSRLGCGTPDAVLCRTNSSVIEYVVRCLNAGSRAHVVGGTTEIMRLLDGAADLQRGRMSAVPDFFGFRDWSEVVSYAREPEGRSLKMFVGMVERYGIENLAAALERTQGKEKNADTVISTAHKAKGREWDRVFLSDDYLPRAAAKGEKTKVDPSEARLFYVAMTRARFAVQLPDSAAKWLGLQQADLPFKPKTLLNSGGLFGSPA